MNAATPPSRSVPAFFVLLFACSLPFWLIGALTGLRLSPGLPVSALMFVCPATAASILVYRADRTAGLRELLQRSFDYARIRSKVSTTPWPACAPTAPNSSARWSSTRGKYRLCYMRRPAGIIVALAEELF